MNDPHDPNAIIATWIEDGPTEIPESTKRAIAVDVRTTDQASPSMWLPWTLPSELRVPPLVLLAMAVLLLVLGGLAWSVIHPDGGGNVGGGGPSVPPSRSPAPSSGPPSAAGETALPIPAMTETHVSERYGYSVGYPAGWSTSAASETWSPPEWRAGDSPQEPFDFISPVTGAPWFRAASAPLPAGLPSVDDWIDENLTFSDAPGCVPPRASWERVLIDGALGRLRDSCGEVEATVVVDERVYMFTLFLRGDTDVTITNGRELFDALAATIDLRPEDAGQSPGPGPS